MKRVFAVAAALALFCSAGSALAQTPPKADPAKLALARELYAEIGGVEAMKAQMNAMFSGLSQVMSTSLPTANPKLSDAIMKDFRDAELDLVPQLIDLSAEIYAENLSEQELRDMLAWSRTPSAHSIRAKLPGVTQQLMVRMGPMMQTLMPGMMQKALDHACEEAKCTPETRKLAAEAMEKALKPKGS